MAEAYWVSTTQFTETERSVTIWTNISVSFAFKILGVQGSLDSGLARVPGSDQLCDFLNFPHHVNSSIHFLNVW